MIFIFLTFKALITAAADDILKYIFFFHFQKKQQQQIRLDISSESSAEQTIQMKCQLIFSEK